MNFPLSKKNNTPRLLLLMLLLGILLRIIITCFFLNDGFVWPDEEEQYYPQALKLYSENIWGDNTKIMPFLPTLLAFLFYFTSGDLLVTRLLLALLSSSLIVITYFLAKEIFNSKVALLSSFICACYPLIVFSSGLLLPEMCFTTLMCLGILCLIKANGRPKSFALAGLVIGIASLTISITVIFFIAIVLMIVIKKSVTLKINKFTSVSSFILTYCLVLCIWGARNYYVIGEFYVVKSNYGEVLHLHNNQYASGFTRKENQMNKEKYFKELEEKIKNKTRIEGNRIYLNEALSFVMEHPFGFFRLCIERFFNLFRLYAGTISSNNFTSNLVSIISIITIGPVLLFSFIGMFYALQDWKNHIYVIIYFMSLIIIFSIIRSSIRARLPLEPFLIIYASSGFFIIIKNIRNLINKKAQ
jgi:4-amino-4-deoxy-L-arabinose transferase-like glycosyltransferase